MVWKFLYFARNFAVKVFLKPFKKTLKTIISNIGCTDFEQVYFEGLLLALRYVPCGWIGRRIIVIRLRPITSQFVAQSHDLRVCMTVNNMVLQSNECTGRKYWEWADEQRNQFIYRDCYLYYCVLLVTVFRLL